MWWAIRSIMSNWRSRQNCNGGTPKACCFTLLIGSSGDVERRNFSHSSALERARNLPRNLLRSNPHRIVRQVRIACRGRYVPVPQQLSDDR